MSFRSPVREDWDERIDLSGMKSEKRGVQGGSIGVFLDGTILLDFVPNIVLTRRWPQFHRPLSV
jgi:hypothetical protein